MDPVDVLRRFNRSYTQRIGVLSDSYLGTGRALGPSRVLFEIGPGGVGVAELRRRLGLDSGYLSRLLRQLERDGLVAVERDATDGRQRIARLTSKGRREWRRLDQRSEKLARTLIEPLSVRQQTELAAALSTVERLLATADVSIEVVDPCSPAAQSALGEYFRELDERFATGFDPGDAGATADAAMLSAPDGAFVVARNGDLVVACGGLQRVDDATAEIKRMWVHREWRGLGLGRTLLARLEALALGLGRERVVLDTNGTLVEAISMYERAGYVPIERYNDNPYAQRWFAKVLARGAADGN